MALKRFKSALADCQTAASLQAASPSPKTLLRLARCQHALGEVAGASSTLRALLEIEPNNLPARELRQRVDELATHLANFERARADKSWGMARLALDQCIQRIEGGAPTQWRLWKIELELVRGNWESAYNAAKYVLGYHAGPCIDHM
jgi:DnaJ homolog subfamily C member 7